MIWSVLFFFFLILSVKHFFFVGCFFIVDIMSVMMFCVVPLVILLIFSFIFSFFDYWDKFKFKSVFFLSTFLVGFCFMVSEPILFLAGLEGTVIPMVILIFTYSKDFDKINSVFFMVFMNLFGSLPFMLFCLYFTDGFNLSVSSIFSFVGSYNLSLFLLVSFCLILVSKLPIFILHFWLTKAHVSASGSCSMLLASLMLKLGSFGLYKYSSIFFASASKIFSGVLSFSLFSIIMFCLVMTRFFDLKHLVACSSIVHMSLVFPLLLKNDSFSVLSSMFMMVGHGLISYLLFFLVTFFYEFSHNRSMDFNKSLESSLKTVSVFLFLFMFVNLGLPPFISFFSELFYCVCLFTYSLDSLLIFTLSMIMSIIFVMFAVSKSLFGKKALCMFSGTPKWFSLINFSFLGFIFSLPFFC